MLSFLKKYRLLFSLIPVGLFIIAIYPNLINLPTGDDIYTMEIFNQLQTAPTWWNKVQLLFSQHNEHRILVTRLVALLQYAISGYVDLRWWIIVGNLSLLLIACLFYKNIASDSWLFLPIVFIIICPASNTLAAMQNANLFSVAFGLASLHFALKNTKPSFDFYAFLFAFLAIFSNGGGFVSFGLMGCIFLFQRRYQLLAIWAIYGLIIFTGYFWNYEKIYRHPTTEKLFEQIPKAARFLIAFAGSIAFSPRLAKITGIVFLGLFGYIIYRRYYLRNPFIFLCFTYGIAMTFLTSLTRYEHGFNTALSERYSIYSMLMSACAIVIVYDFLKESPRSQNYALIGFCILSILLNLKYVTLKLRDPEGTKLKLLTKMENYRLNDSGYTCVEVSILHRLAQNRFYDYPITQPIHPKSYYDSLNRPLLPHIKLRVDRAYVTNKNINLRCTFLSPVDAAAQLKKIGLKYLFIHNDDSPLDCSHNEFTNPNNDQTMILDMELENDRHHLDFPQFEVILPKKHFWKGKYALYFVFLTDAPVNYRPVKTNVAFRL